MWAGNGWMRQSFWSYEAGGFVVGGDGLVCLREPETVVEGGVAEGYSVGGGEGEPDRSKASSVGIIGY